MDSQRSFQSVLGKYSDGVEVVKRVTIYNPSKEELKLSFLESLKMNANLKNQAVVSTGSVLKELRTKRRLISFKAKDTDINCMENLLKNITSYLKAELGEKSASYQKINSLIKKIQPPPVQKEETKEGEEPKKSISTSEKTYQALVGYAKETLTVISDLGDVYNPPNANISKANFTTKVDELEALNTSVGNAETDFSTAVSQRDQIYNGEKGISNVITGIKDYLASFEGGKKNADYIAFVNAVK